MTRLLVVLSAVCCCGCFVFDELAEGQKIMEQLGPGESAQKTEESAPPATPATGADGPGPLERVKAWWDEARSSEPAGPDPDDSIVRCTVRGSTQFMRESDCELRGGRASG